MPVPRPFKARLTPSVQRLERRVLFAGISLSGTTLRVTGTAGADAIEVAFDPSSRQITARLNGSSQTFSDQVVGRIVLSGSDGNDTISARGLDRPVELIGGNGNDTLRGGEAADVLSGGAGDDELFGMGGDDKPDGGSGADFISGGAGQDWVSYAARTAPLQIDLDGAADDGEAGERDNVMPDVEHVAGGTGDDVITGSEADNILEGEAGDDILTGLGGDDDFYDGPGDDVMLGGRGNDSFHASNDVDNDVLDGGDGNDDLRSWAGDDRLLGGPGHDTLSDVDGNNFLDGGPDPDQVGSFTEPGFTGGATVTAEGVLLVTGTATSDTVWLEPSGNSLLVRVNFFDDYVSFAGVRSIRVETGAGDDRISIAQFSDDLPVPITILAGDGDDRALNANASPATLDGGNGNDILTGGDGPDLLRGGGGNDQLFGNHGDDVLVDTSGTNVLDGGPGADRINGVPDGDRPDPIRLEGTTLFLDGTDAGEGFFITNDTRADGPVYNVRIDYHSRSFRPGQVTRVVIRAGGGNDTVQIMVPVPATVDLGAGDDSALTSDANDVITGGDGADRITSNGGNDEISGGAGNDIINSGRGTDRVSGGDGEDELNDPDGTSGLDGGSGNDTLNGVPDSAGDRTTYEAENAATLVGVSRITGGYPGHTGTGYADFSRDTGGYIEWVVESSAAATKGLTFHYANGGSSDRPLELSVNGQVVRPRLAFAPTGSWGVWRTTESVPVQLRAGTNRIRIASVGSNGGNIDSMTLSDSATPAPQTLQAEQAARSGAVFSNANSGYEGSGFVDYKNASGDWVEWKASVPSEGERTLTFRYANGSSLARPLELRVNGSVVNPALAFGSTGDWRTWQTVSVTVRLRAGDNTIRLTATGSSGPNIDWMRVG